MPPIRSVLGASGVVVIGRNEGERLRRCLESVRNVAEYVVYVDSGSSDGSVALARARGFAVVELACGTPFTAARARNEGYLRLFSEQPQLDYVFFVDGDCEIAEGWLGKAARFLDQHPDVAVVCGRLRERYPEKSVYNMLCDIEWDVPPGESTECGGNAVVRTVAFQQVKGYRSDLACGEEPELCVRLRQSGWRIWRLGEEMGLHDAALYHFSQWWRRMLRNGYAFALGAALHGTEPERHWVWQSLRAWLWSLGIPLAVLASTLAIGRWALLLFLVYPLQVIRLALYGRRSARENWWRATALVFGMFPEMLGQVMFILDRHQRVRSRLIEYK